MILALLNRALKIELTNLALANITPRGIRIPVTSVKGRCPRPLDDGGRGEALICSLL